MSYLQAAFGTASAVVLAVSGPSYLMSTIRGQTKPQRATWFIWSVLGVTAFVAQLSLGGTWSLLFTGIEGGGNVAMFLLSLKYGTGGWSKLDRIALAVAAAGIVLSLVIHRPIVALFGVVVADAAGVGLTIRKAYLAPKTESAIVWFLIGTSGLLAAAAVGRLDFQLLLYPVYFAVANYGVVTAQRLGLRRHPSA